jgi:serine phosphatase RsbU (regulator of sigma subunit)
MGDGHPTRWQGADAVVSPEIVDALFDEAPFGLAIVDAEMRFVRVNQRLADMHGLTAAEHAGRPVRELRPGATGTGIEAAAREVLRTGKARAGILIEGPTVSESATRHFVGSYLPIRGAVLAIVQDDTDRIVAERERARLLRAAHAAQARTATLQAVTEALNEALSPDEVATRIVAETRRATGAVAGIVAVRENGDVRVLHQVGYVTDDDRERLSILLDTPLTEAVREERMVLLEGTADRERYADAPTFGLEAGAYVPLTYEGHPVGVMGLGFSAPGEFEEDERAFLTAVARQCAQAMVRAQLYEQRSDVARRLQRQLLPQRMPRIEWLDTWSSYRALGEGTEVGGDFYDVMPAGGGWAALIGDVQGKGIDAAGVAGAARHIIRGLARALDDPALIVQGANEALVADLDVDRFVTLALAICTRTGHGVLARIASAGHPPALVLRNDGTVERVDEPGLIIGVDLEARYEEAQVRLALGETLVLYTDGILEARAGRESFGDARLAAAVASASGGGAQEVVRAVTSAVMQFEGGRARDDQAVLCLRAC